MSTKKKTETKKAKPKKTEAKASAAASETPVDKKSDGESSPKGEGSAATESSASTGGKGGIQNGKGSAPRNISPRFRSNYDGIRWETAKKRKRTEGEKFVKTY